MPRWKENGDWRFARILMIDDEPLINKTVGAILKTGRFTCIDSITDPHQAFSKIAEYQPDLILLDIKMPEIDGLELLKSIKSDEATAGIIVVMLSAADEESKWDSLELGAVDFINKPVNPQELILRVRHALRSHRTK